jgi:hypothetical protein
LRPKKEKGKKKDKLACNASLERSTKLYPFAPQKGKRKKKDKLACNASLERSTKNSKKNVANSIKNQILRWKVMKRDPGGERFQPCRPSRRSRSSEAMPEGVLDDRCRRIEEEFGRVVGFPSGGSESEPG